MTIQKIPDETRNDNQELIKWKTEKSQEEAKKEP
jgi:hypothetical protein